MDKYDKYDDDDFGCAGKEELINSMILLEDGMINIDLPGIPKVVSVSLEQLKLLMFHPELIDRNETLDEHSIKFWKEFIPEAYKVAVQKIETYEYFGFKW